jgi:hypothetical protein
MRIPHLRDASAAYGTTVSYITWRKVLLGAVALRLGSTTECDSSAGLQTLRIHTASPAFTHTTIEVQSYSMEASNVEGASTNVQQYKWHKLDQTKSTVVTRPESLLTSLHPQAVTHSAQQNLKPGGVCVCGGGGGTTHPCFCPAKNSPTYTSPRFSLVSWPRPCA